MSFLRGAIIGCAVSSAVLTAPVSHAAPLFQSIPDLVTDTITAPWCSSCDGSYRIFDTFSLGSSSSVGSVTVRCAIAALAAPYAMNPSNGSYTAMLAIFTTVPPALSN